MGGLSMIQMIRYHETPVGPYDEIILMPGSFEYPVEDKDGKKAARRALRITRIYVSQKYTCWNSRKIWNIPKHLARFEWTDRPDGSTHIKVFPHDDHRQQPYDPSESRPSDRPFFQCIISPVRYFPSSLPMSTALLSKLGMDLTIVQPPLPEGKAASEGELPGTEEWAALAGYRQSARKGCLAWVDLRQENEEGGGGGGGDGYENFWPGLGRWRLAVKLDRGEAEFPEGPKWPTPRHLL
ncbi:hypothetical protein VTK56DRAFT_7236 [Thermocarpiscus australiensis]